MKIGKLLVFGEDLTNMSSSPMFPMVTGQDWQNMDIFTIQTHAPLSSAKFTCIFTVVEIWSKESAEATKNSTVSCSTLRPMT